MSEPCNIGEAMSIRTIVDPRLPVAAGAVGYDSALLNKKLKDADSGNPNIYSSIEDLKADNKHNMDHVYDEIKGVKVLKEEGKSLF